MWAMAMVTEWIVFSLRHLFGWCASSLVMCRGYYTRTILAAFDFKNNKLMQHWVFDTK